MPKKTDKENIKQVIADYIQQHGVTNVRDISEYVYDTLGFFPSTGTVSKVLQDMGYFPKRQPSFIWRHNKGEK